MTLRHNEIRHITAKLLDEVCVNVRSEPILMALDGEQSQYRTANRSREARLDISATGFWTPGQRAFFDIRVFDLSARRYRGLELSKCFKRNEDEKKRHYHERVNTVEYGTFSPLVFSTNGGMGRECGAFYKRLSEMIAGKTECSSPTNYQLHQIKDLIQFATINFALYQRRMPIVQ